MEGATTSERAKGEGLVIQYAYAPRRDAFLDLLAEVERSLESAEASLGAGLSGRFRRDLREARRRLERPFNLMVVGEFKRGKSTLVNALMRETLVTTDVTPETVLVTHIRHGDHRRALICTEDGGEAEVSWGELRSDRLQPLLDRLGQPASHLLLEAPVPSLEGWSVTDTPGTGDLFRRFDRHVASHLHEADAIVFVVSALSPLSEEERSFLELSLRPLELSKVCFVVNMVDTLPGSEDTERILERVRGQLASRFPGSSVFAVSALDEMSRYTDDEDAPRPKRHQELGERFAAFRRHLDDAVVMNRDMVRLENATRQATLAFAELRRDAARLREGLAMEVGALERRMREQADEREAMEQRLVALSERLQREGEQLSTRSVAWMGEFVDRLDRQVLETLEQHPYDVVQRHFPFFLTERLRAGWQVCQEAFCDDMMLLLHEVAPERVDIAGESEADALDGLAARQTFLPPELTNTTGMMVAIDLVARFGVLSAGFAGLCATVLGVLDKEAGAETRGRRYKESIRESLGSFKVQLGQEIEAAAGGIIKEAQGALERAYAEEGERLALAMEQVLALQREGEAHCSQQREALFALDATLDTAIARMQDLRA